jgi:PAS domain S-box-containing protein
MILQVLNIASYTLNPLAVPLLLVACLFFFFALRVLFAESLNVSIGFFVLGISAAIWFVSYFFLYCSSDAHVALWWVKAAYVGIPFIPAALYHFCLAILQAQRRERKTVWIGWTLSAIFMLVILCTDLIIDGVRHFWWGHYARYTKFSLLYLAFALGFQVFIFLRLFRAYRKTAPGSTSYLRIRSLLIAFIIASFGFVDYVPKFGVSIYPFGYIPVLIAVILLERVVRLYRLVDITPRFAAPAIISTMKDSLLALDENGVIRFINQATVRLLGHAEQDLVGKALSAIFDNPLFWDHIVALGEGGKLENLEMLYSHPNGQTYILELSTSCMRDEHNRSLAYVLLLRDITRIKQTEMELIKARDELEARIDERSSDLRKVNEQLAQEKVFSDTIIDNLPGVFFICDEEGRLIRWNNNEKESTGYSQQEISQMTVLQLFQQDHELVRTRMQEVFESGQAVMEASLVTKSGMSIPFYMTGFRMVIGTMRYLVGVGINISERKRLEHQLLQAQKMEAVGVLAGGVAHDFNNILTAIIGYASLLNLKIPSDDPLRFNVEQIMASSERAVSLTQSLLAFSRKQVVDLKTLNVNDVISGFHKILARLIGEDIEFTLDLAADRPLVKADKGQLEQVFMNLATNARDAMPRGGKLRITTETASFSEDSGEIKRGSYVIVSVSDTGIGMDNETLEHIFEPFYTSKEVGKGTGLGLAIVYGIMKKHDGVITVQSEPDKGTTFNLCLPTTQYVVKEDKRDDQALFLWGSETILLVEDEEPVRRMTKSIFEDFGYRVLEAVDGDDAIRVFRENRDHIELVLCDLIMPKKNGKEAYDEFMKIQPGIKTIFTSGYTADILAQKGLQEERLHFISKPFTPATLLLKVREVLHTQ